MDGNERLEQLLNRGFEVISDKKNQLWRTVEIENSQPPYKPMKMKLTIYNNGKFEEEFEK